ncbi:hypothetical protein [Bacillus sp. NPDC094106]|uniref:hypothetical protein n=1 Tax=Bacillus sp. NPDC094106 TaxID=3363949 RepID=UPI003804AD0D
MINQKMKDEYVQKEKMYKKKGMENCYPIGKLVRVDWDTPIKYQEFDSGQTSIESMDERLRKWVDKQNGIYIVTDVSRWGMCITVELDNRFVVSGWKLLEVDTGERIYPKKTQ